MGVCHQVADQHELRIFAAVVFAVMTGRPFLRRTAISGGNTPSEHDGLRERRPYELPVLSIAGTASHLDSQRGTRGVAARQEDIQDVLAQVDIALLVLRKAPLELLTAVDQKIYIAVGDVVEALRQFADK